VPDNNTVPFHCLARQRRPRHGALYCCFLEPGQDI